MRFLESDIYIIYTYIYIYIYILYMYNVYFNNFFKFAAKVLLLK